MTNKSASYDKWTTWTGKVLGRIIVSFITAWVSLAIYGHFAQRFGWPALSYWDVWFIYIVIGSVGYVLRGGPSHWEEIK